MPREICLWPAISPGPWATRGAPPDRKEKQLAAWTAIRYSSDHIFDYIELNVDHAIVEVAVPEAWAGRTVGDLDVRRKYGLNVLAVKRQGKMNANVASDTMLLRDETVLVLGSNQAIQRCFHL